MLLLLPGGQIGAIGLLLVTMAEFFVWPSIFPNATTLSGFTYQQWGSICLMFAF